MAITNAQSAPQDSQYEWPGWDKSLGDPPVINLTGKPDKAFVDEFNQVLTNIANMSHSQSADALRTQLKELSGVPINIHPALGEAPGYWKPDTTPPKKHDDPPAIKYSPDVWGRYPVKGSQIEEEHLSLPVFSRPVSEWLASMHHPNKYSEYAIAPPEQIFLHELGHYVHFHHAHQLLIKSYTEDKNPMNPGSIYYQAMDFIKKGVDETYITETYENQSMKSAIPGFRERDSKHHDECVSFIVGKDGVPVVGDQEREALERALKVHPLNNYENDRDQIKQPSGNPDSKNMLEHQAGINKFSPEKMLVFAASAIAQSDLSGPEKQEKFAALARVATGAGLSVAEVQEQHQSVDYDRQFT